MRRFDALKAIAPLIGDSLVVTNLANTATEWRAVRPHEGNLYFVGMGMVMRVIMIVAFGRLLRRCRQCQRQCQQPRPSESRHLHLSFLSMDS